MNEDCVGSEICSTKKNRGKGNVKKGRGYLRRNAKIYYACKASDKPEVK